MGCGVFNFDEVSLHHIYTYIHYIILYYAKDTISTVQYMTTQYIYYSIKILMMF